MLAITDILILRRSDDCGTRVRVTLSNGHTRYVEDPSRLSLSHIDSRIDRLLESERRLAAAR